MIFIAGEADAVISRTFDEKFLADVNVAYHAAQE